MADNIFYSPDIQGNTHTLDETESKHCTRVLRLSEGDDITLVDGHGGMFTARITNANPKKCAVEIIKAETNFGARTFSTHIAIAPTKNIERTEWFLEKATEIGIDRISPLLCRFSERKEVKRERLEKIMVSAMKQSLKAFLPKLDDMIDFQTFIKIPFEGQKFIAYCGDTERALLKNIIQKKGNYLILIGPEGDFSAAEVEMAIGAGFIPVSLGNSRLRTETAGLAACHTFALVND